MLKLYTKHYNNKMKEQLILEKAIGEVLVEYCDVVETFTNLIINNEADEQYETARFNLNKLNDITEISIIKFGKIFEGTQVNVREEITKLRQTIENYIRHGK